MVESLLALLLNTVTAVPAVSANVAVRPSTDSIDAGADAIELDVHLRNDSREAICLVHYVAPAIYLDEAARTMTYVDDLMRGPDLLNCGGAYSFPKPEYHCLDPKHTLTLRVQAWVMGSRQFAGAIARTTTQERSTPVLSPGDWTLTAELTILPKSEIRDDLRGVPLCVQLAARERVQSTGVTVVVAPDPGAAWSRRRAALATDRINTPEGLYILERYVPFFENVTHIEATRDGRSGLPSVRPGLLDRWDDWYSHHGKNLRWSDAAGRYVVDDSLAD